ncbi:MAG: hypothetical protein E5V65_12480 [Mesorhizobium sp.]|nr:MAG: hypothetical protein E5V65_12480 [Mesorhizobium sp.]
MCSAFGRWSSVIPPSALPGISPTRGEIGCRGRFRQSPTLLFRRPGEQHHSILAELSFQAKCKTSQEER